MLRFPWPPASQPTVSTSVLTPAPVRDAVPRADGAWTQRVGPLCAIPRLLDAQGIAPAPLLASLGLAPDALDDPEGRIPFATFAALLAACARRTGCAHFALMAGERTRLASTGLVGELARNCATVGDALRSIAVYHRLNAQGAAAYVMEQESTATFGYVIYAPCASHADHVYAGVLAAGVGMVRELCGPSWNPAEVLLPYAAPDDVEPYRRLFRAPLRFDSSQAALRFPADWLTHRVAGADPQRHRELERQLLALGGEGLVPRLYRSLRLLMLEGGASGDGVAQIVAMHRRTLNRRLQAEGRTFQAVLDEVRYEAARQFLEHGRLSLIEIAGTLGYAEASAFTRAFRRWSGTTPKQWRAARGRR
jgi:AraC-like DNA-binding protein